ncbi:PapD-like protein [Trichophaea hybrida]|nr:PapD-like protein [Trichophaea hybrida]
MSIELEPSELTFQRPFNREVTQTLHIRNPNYDPVAFKVKTTAPKQYCVRPNSGRIESGKEVEVQVLLQAMKNDPPADYKCRDKFLVQSVAITADREATNVQQIWSHVEQTEKTAIRERKIRVVYLQPGEQSNGNTAGDPSFAESSPPPYTSPSPPDDVQSTPSSVPRPTSQREAPSALTSNTHSTRPGSDDKDAELAAAKATIARLEAELNNQGLRLRKTAGAASDAKDRITEGTAGMGMTTHPTEGIPVQICAALCLLSFFIAWFFF